MIEVDEKELQVLVELADRALKSPIEQYALAAIVARLNEAQEKKRMEQSTALGEKAM